MFSMKYALAIHEECKTAVLYCKLELLAMWYGKELFTPTFSVNNVIFNIYTAISGN